MPIKDIIEINKEWEDFFQEMFDDPNDFYSFWHYKPFSDDYWNERTKIVFCNVEAHGNSGGNCYLTLDIFKSWLGNITSKRTVLFLYCLYKQLHNISVNEKQLRELFYKNDELLNGIRNTTYMNLRKEVKYKDGPNEDTDGILRSLVHGMKYSEKDEDDSNNHDNRKLTLAFIDALEPDIFIITGRTGLLVLKDIYSDIIDLNGLSENGMYKTKKTLYVHLEHPSRAFSYDYIIKNTRAIYDELQK